MLQGHCKIYHVVTPTAEPSRVKTACNSQRSKATNAVLLTQSRSVSVGEALMWRWSIKFCDNCYSKPTHRDKLQTLL
jgi:hypothetical protein